MKTCLPTLLWLVALAASAPALAATREVAPAENLQEALSAAAPGDVLKLLPGRHAGPVTIDKSLHLVGTAGTELVGTGTGSVITLISPDVRISGLTISGSGTDLPAMDAGILAKRQATGAVITGNRFEGNLFGVYLHGAAGSLVQDNEIIGRRDLRMSEAGNGVSIWNAPGVRIVDNDVRYGRDGIFVTTSRDVLFQDNSFAELRFAIHYMYTQDSRVIGNRSTGNHVGWAIMFSDRLEIRDNVSIGDRDHGLMLNAANESLVTGNIVRDGQEKCVFIYNANKNVIAENWFEGCPIGIHFTAGSERNKVAGNAFIRNRVQVKYVGTRRVEWSADGRGNYWSDNSAFDLDGDGTADAAFRPNDLMDEVLWTLPQAKLLLNSPAVQTLRWAQARFPALYPGGVVDAAPLMQPPPALAERARR